MRTINHLEVLVEELSMEIALRNLLPRIVPGVGFDIHTFQGKPDLLKKLGARLTGYSHWLPKDMAVVVVVDRDFDDCHDLKKRLESKAMAAGLATMSTRGLGAARVLNRIAIEELEAWFLGDVPALVRAYPGVPGTLSRRQRFRAPDAISGGTAEALEDVLRKAGHFQGGLSKTSAARTISLHMNVDTNSSPSFCQFRDGLRRLVDQGVN